MRNSHQIGFWSWLLHRLTGLVLTFYLFVHLYILSQIKQPERFESLLSASHHPLVKFLETLLFATFLIHLLLGLRIILLELGVPTKYHKPLAYISFLLTFILWLITTLFIVFKES